MCYRLTISYLLPCDTLFPDIQWYITMDSTETHDPSLYDTPDDMSYDLNMQLGIIFLMILKHNVLKSRFPNIPFFPD